MVRGLLSARLAAAAVADGSVSVREIAEDTIRYISVRDGELGAFRSLHDEVITRSARGLDRRSRGPLSGVMVAVKDVIDTADLPTGYGSSLFEDHRPTADAAVIGELRSAGALIVGKAETSEFGIGQCVRTRNPVDLSRTAGASSGGSAAAVAAGMVPVALGVQTAGSVIRPAAYCGIYGFKPARGWVSTDGIWPLAPALDTVGLFARSAADLELVYRAIRRISRPGRMPPAPIWRPRKAAIMAGTEWAVAGPEVLDALDRAATALTLAGWAVEELPMPASWRRLPAQHDIMMITDIARNMRRVLGPRLRQVSPAVEAEVERGGTIPARERNAASRAASAALADLRPVAARYELIVAPSALRAAPVGARDTDDAVMCRPWTMLGLPAANVPAGRDRAGLPIGVQAIGTAPADHAFLLNLMSLEPGLAGGD